MFSHPFRDCVDACDDGKEHDLDINAIHLSIWHRISFARDGLAQREDGRRHWPDVSPIKDDELTAILMAERFSDTRRVVPGEKHWADRPGAWTGGETPYTVLILTDGSIEQALKFQDRGAHARRWNSVGVGVAVVGDFQRGAPTAEQWVSCVELGAALHAWGCAEKGHTELPGASRDPTKECPGRHFDMDALRYEILQHPFSRLDHDQAVEILRTAGLHW